jgi:hypothetical protein
MNSRRVMTKSSVIAIVMMILLVMVTPLANGTGVKTIRANSPEYEIISRDDGQIIRMDDSWYLMVPGKPMLPSKSLLIALPPGARVQSVEVKGIGSEQLPGAYQIMPSPLIRPMTDLTQQQEFIKRLQDEWEDNNQATYSSDEAYPRERGGLKSSGTLRKYSYASVSFYPFSYHAQSGRLVYYHAAQIDIHYDLPPPGSLEAQRAEEMKWDEKADQRASRLFINYQEVKDLYKPSGASPKAWQDTYDYVIITTSDLLGAIISSDFLSWKTILGYNVRTVLLTDPEITGQSGADLGEQIRNFLRGYYSPWGIEYVFLVGDYATIPMRYCYPDSNNHLNGAGNPAAWPWSGDVPTDYYYADLSSSDADSWDSDGDGYLGEYNQDSPDLLAEVYVGRIPTNNTDRITYTLNKLVAFEQDTGAWKQNALHAGAIAYFANEDYSLRDFKDLACYIDSIETDFMSGWTISHYSEREGLVPSVYDWPAVSEEAFIGDWRNGQYGVVNWGAHGWSNRVGRKIWAWDDGDGVPESHEMSHPDLISIYSDLDDDYPSIVYALSCLVGYPEPNAWGNLGIDLLTKPGFGSSVGTLSGTRIVWVSLGGGELRCYHFNHFLIDSPGGPERVGNALYDSKFYCDQNYSWDHYSEYWNAFGYNLYGDPSLIREGIFQFVRGDCNGNGTVEAGDVVYLINYLFQNGPSPDPLEAGDANCDSLVETSDVVYLINYLFRGGPPPGCLKG